MKPNRSVCLCVGCTALAALLALPACAPVGTDKQPPAETVTPDTSALASQRAYYEALIAELRQALLDEKQNDFITRAEYESRIRALEDELARLEIPNPGSDLPVSGNPADPPADTDTRPHAESSDSPTNMAFRYGITEGEVTVYEYLGSQSDVVIPSVIEGYPVTHIADNAFQATAVTSVTIPFSVTHIGWFAFADCVSLTSVTLPASVESIGYGAFDGCPRVTLRCPADSYAEQYAMSFGMRFTYT